MYDYTVFCDTPPLDDNDQLTVHYSLHYSLVQCSLFNALSYTCPLADMKELHTEQLSVSFKLDIVDHRSFHFLIHKTANLPKDHRIS